MIEIFNFNEELPCVYFLLNDDELIYIGQTENLKRRLYQHVRGTWFQFEKKYNRVFVEIIKDKKKRREIEKKLICEYSPKYNSIIMDEYRPQLSFEEIARDFNKVKW